MNATDQQHSWKAFVQDEPPKHYLSEEHTLRGWLLTTDHKRIGLLYLFSIIFYFAIAAIAATARLFLSRVIASSLVPLTPRAGVPSGRPGA